MPVNAGARTELCRLRRDIAEIEERFAEEERLAFLAAADGSGPAPGSGRASPDEAGDPQMRPARRRLPFGVPALDAVLGGGLPLGTLHEIRACESRDGAAAGGFVASLVAHLAACGLPPAVLWISGADTRRETGNLYAPGLHALGLDPAALVEVAVRTEAEALWAFEAALSCRALGAAICELRQVSLALSATRRCALRARARGVTGFLMRVGNSWAEPSAAELRFAVSPAPAGAIGRFDAGIGRMAWRLILEKNRLGPTGAFTLEWDAYGRNFAARRDAGGGARSRRRKEGWANPQPLSAAARDGSVASFEEALALRYERLRLAS